MDQAPRLTDEKPKETSLRTALARTRGRFSGPGQRMAPGCPAMSAGWVEYRHGWQLADPARQREVQARLTEAACLLDQDQRRLVELTIADHCRVRGWTLHTVNCRSNHGTSSWRATANPRRSGSSSKPGAPAGSRRCSRNVAVHSPHRIARPRRFARNGGLSGGKCTLCQTTRKALRPSSTTSARHKIMQINLNPTSARGASRDAVNRPRETLGDSHLISSDPRLALRVGM